MNELLPCPFCGSTEIKTAHNRLWCSANNCPIQFITIDPAKWNTRAPLQNGGTDGDAVARDVVRHGDDAGDGMRYVLCKIGIEGVGRYANWLLVPHADGQYVTAARLGDFALSIIRSQLAAIAQSQPIDQAIAGKGELS